MLASMSTNKSSRAELCSKPCLSALEGRGYASRKGIPSPFLTTTSREHFLPALVNANFTHTGHIKTTVTAWPALDIQNFLLLPTLCFGILTERILKRLKYFLFHSISTLQYLFKSNHHLKFNINDSQPYYFFEKRKIYEFKPVIEWW